jgi:hypothetical protein
LGGVVTERASRSLDASFLMATSYFSKKSWLDYVGEA